MKQKPNIIWFHLDGIRPNKNFGDHKDRPHYLDKLAEEGVEYTNVYTAHASTLMSLSSVMFGYPTPYYTKCLENIDINTEQFKPLTYILKEAGYEFHSFLLHRPTRKILNNIMGQVTKKYYASNMKDYDYMWNSKQANKFILKFLKNKKLKNPYFLYLHYPFVGIKGDDSYNDARKMINFLKKGGYFDNSIILFWADHGWPAKEKDIERGRLKRVLEGHDIILSNENIKVPLILIYPNCKKGLKINTPVSTLDIGPTLLKILGIDTKFGHTYFSKILPLTEKKDERIFRVDTRHYFHKGRKSCLVNTDYKYLFNFNTKIKEEFYDIKNNIEEDKNLIFNPLYKKQINKFKTELKFQEDDLFNFQVNYLINKLKNRINLNKNVLILESENNLFDSVLYTGFKSLVKKVNMINESNLNIKLKQSSVDELIILPLDNLFNIYKNILKQLKNQNITYFYIDFNFNLIKNFSITKYIFKNIKINWRAFLKQPKICLRWLLILYLRPTGKID